jgi:cell division protein ZipA
MVLWAIFSEGSKRKKINFYDDHDHLENIDPSLVVSTQDDDFDIVSISTGEEDDSQVKTRLNTEYMQEAQQSGVNANTLNSNAVAKPSVQAATENKPVPVIPRKDTRICHTGDSIINLI